MVVVHFWVAYRLRPVIAAQQPPTQQQMMMTIMTGHTTKMMNSTIVTPTITPTTSVQNIETMYRLDNSKRDLTDIDIRWKITSPSKPEGGARLRGITRPRGFPKGVYVS